MKKRIIFALFLIGFAAILGQIILMRELLIVFYGNELSTGVVLANWLIWTSASSLGAEKETAGKGHPFGGDEYGLCRDSLRGNDNPCLSGIFRIPLLELSSLAVANFSRGSHRPYGAPQSSARSDCSTVTLEGGIPPLNIPRRFGIS